MVSSRVTLPVSAAQPAHEGGRQLAAHGKSMFALVAFDRLPCRRPGDAVGVENIPQFDERALRRQHRFARRGGGCLHFGGPGMRRRHAGFVGAGFDAGGTVSNSEISSCGFAGEALTRLCRTCPLACISSGGLSDDDFCAGGFSIGLVSCAGPDETDGWGRGAGTAMISAMAGALAGTPAGALAGTEGLARANSGAGWWVFCQAERIEENDRRRGDEKASGDNAHIAPAAPRRPA